MATVSPSLILLLVAAFASVHVRGLVDLDLNCSKQDPSPLNFDLFMELLSNHSDVARSLTRAPIFGDMDPDTPAYEITGRGFHFTDSFMSKDIQRALCANNEVTFYFSMYLIKAHSSGTLLEISSGRGTRLPVFGVYFNAAANEIMFTYRHRGMPHTVTVDQRLHTGRWRKYSLVLSGHLLQFYYDCDLIFSDIIALPDFCIDETSYVVSFADDSDRVAVAHNNGIHAFFQNVGFYLGRGGLVKQCPGTGKECPTCGQYLQLVQKAYKLQEENERLKAEIKRLTSLGTTERERAVARFCIQDDVTVANGNFSIIDGGICYCRNGELQCNMDMSCQDNTTVSSDHSSVCDACKANQRCVNGACECDEGFLPSSDGECVEDKTCTANNEVLQLGERSYLFRDNGTPNPGDDMCRVFTCQINPSISLVNPVPLTTVYSCPEMVEVCGCGLEMTSSDCTADLDILQRNILICCQNCTPCNFMTCGRHASCSVENSRAVCSCDQFYEENEEGECVDIDECATGVHTCGEFSICVNREPRYDCNCIEGYKKISDLEVKCQDLDECDINPCPANSRCNNTEGSFTCDCVSGYEMTDDRQCAPVCDEPCQNGGNCVAPNTCSCHPGYSGPQCADDIDECALPTNMCTHDFSECVNTIGGHFCRCRIGYHGNGTYCEDINECVSNIHKCIRRGPNSCINTEGSYVCSCDMVDCTGHCRRRGVEYANGQSFTDPTNMCKNCTCLNGEIFCHRWNCDGACTDPTIRKCCSKCGSRDCNLEQTDSDTIVLRPNSIWVDPKNPCIRHRCSSKLQLTEEDLSSECPPLNCATGFLVPQPGRCCPICLLPPCSREKEATTLSLKNGCRQCTCRSGTWSCEDVVTCPEGPWSNCAPKDILFYNHRCCPVCESGVLGSTCQTFARN